MDEPVFLSVGTEVSAKFKGAFCEARVKKAHRNIKCKVIFKNSSYGSMTVDESKLSVACELRVNMEVMAPVNCMDGKLHSATLATIKDCSLYTVVFNDDDERTLRRNQLCPKGAKYFASCMNLDDLPLGNPDRFGTPHSPAGISSTPTTTSSVTTPCIPKRNTVSRQGISRLRYAESSESDSELLLPVQPLKSPQSNKKKSSPKNNLNYYSELVGNVVTVKDELHNAPQSASELMIAAVMKQKPRWFPCVVVCPSAQKNIQLTPPDEILVRSFRDGKFIVITRSTVEQMDISLAKRIEHYSMKPAIHKALDYLEKEQLPPHWDRGTLFKPLRESSSEDGDSDSCEDVDDSSEQRDRFVAQLYKYHDEKGTPINKAPVLGGQDLNLYKFYSIVMKFGGYNRVCNNGTWREVLAKMKLEGCPGATVTTVKNCYNRYLLGYDTFYKQLGWSMEESTNRSRNINRVNRSINMANIKSNNNTPSCSKVEKPEKKTPKVEPKVEVKREPDIKPEIKPEKQETKTIILKEEIKTEVAVEKAKSPPKAESPKTPSINTCINDIRGVPVLSVGQKIQAPYGKPPNIRWYEARVLQIDGGVPTNKPGQLACSGRVYIHYHGWKSRYNEWIDATCVHVLDEPIIIQTKHKEPTANCKEDRDKLENVPKKGGSSPIIDATLVPKPRQTRTNSIASEISNNSDGIRDGKDTPSESGKDSPAMRKLALARKIVEQKKGEEGDSDVTDQSESSVNNSHNNIIKECVASRCASVDNVTRRSCVLFVPRKRPPSTPLPTHTNCDSYASPARKRCRQERDEQGEDSGQKPEKAAVTRSRTGNVNVNVNGTGNWSVNCQTNSGSERMEYNRPSSRQSRSGSRPISTPQPIFTSLHDEMKHLIHKAEMEAECSSGDDWSDNEEDIPGDECNTTLDSNNSRDVRPPSTRKMRQRRRKRQYSHMDIRPQYRYRNARKNLQEEDNTSEDETGNKEAGMSPKDSMASIRAKVLVDLEENPQNTPQFNYNHIDASITGVDRVNLIVDRMQQIKQIYSKLRDRLSSLEGRFKRTQENKKKKVEAEKLQKREEEVIRLLYKDNQQGNE